MKILTGLLAAAAIACAQPSFGWSATVRPPHPALPAVDVILGYGDYVPERGSPIELRAKAPFTGMIGYHFERYGKRTIDVPRVTRGPSLRGVVRLAADQIGKGPSRPMRELVVEWRDPAGTLLGIASAGTPPWAETRTAARIAAQPPANPHYLGQPAVTIDPTQLPAWPGWYAGFTAVIAPADLWLTLDPDVRKAVFHSGVQLILFGLPGSGAIVLPTDEAILPVTFSAAGARPKPNAAWLAGDNGPQLVRAAGAAWAESEEGLREPLPQTTALHLRGFEWEGGRWSLRAALAEYRTIVFLVTASLLSLLVWWLARRGAAIAAAAIAIALIAAHPLYRQIIRPRTLQHTTDTWEPITSETSFHRRLDAIYGDVPLQAPARERLAIQDSIETAPAARYAEVSADGDPVRLAHASSWAGWQQESWRRELANAANVTVEQLGDDVITISYDLPDAPRRINANWSYRGRPRYGTGEAAGGRRGRATIARGQRGSPNDSTYIWEDLPRSGNAETVNVSFITEERGTTRVYGWYGKVDERQRFVPYRMVVSVCRAEDGNHMARLVIPAGGIPPAGEVRLLGAHAMRDILSGGAWIEGNGVRVPIQPRDKRPYRVTWEDFRRVARDHGLITIHLPAKLDPRFFEGAEIEVRVSGAEP